MQGNPPDWARYALPDATGAPLWTDDFSNLTQILNWKYILPWEEKDD